MLYCRGTKGAKFGRGTESVPLQLNGYIYIASGVRASAVSAWKQKIYIELRDWYNKGDFGAIV